MDSFSYKDESSAAQYWNSDPAARLKPSGTYVAVSGNTGSGKSTLVTALSRHLRARGEQAIGINERVLHHPLLPLMFHRPQQYAFGIQLNFLLQRHLILKRWLELGFTVVSERSHLDDRLYMETHLDEGNVTKDELAAYDLLFTTLGRSLPDPDYYIFLDAPAQLSIQRLTAAAQAGERPEEFPDDTSRQIFVAQWQRRFRRHFEGLTAAQAQGRFRETCFLTWPAETPTLIILEHITSSLSL